MVGCKDDVKLWKEGVIVAVEIGYLIGDFVEFREIFVTIVWVEMPFNRSDIYHPIHQRGRIIVVYR